MHLGGGATYMNYQLSDNPKNIPSILVKYNI